MSARRSSPIRTIELRRRFPRPAGRPSPAHGADRATRLRRGARRGRSRRGRAGALEAEADDRPRLSRRSSSPPRCGLASRRSRAGECPAGIGISSTMRAPRPPCGAPVGGRSAGARPGADRDRGPPADAQRVASGGERIDGHQPADPRRGRGAPRAPALAGGARRDRSRGGLVAFEVFIGIFFVLACAGYWIYERSRAVDLVTSMCTTAAQARARHVGADRPQARRLRPRPGLVVALVATVLSIVFWLIGLPFWLLLGIFAGVVEIVPVIGPLSRECSRSASG